MTFSISQISKMAHISVRTLHYYDKEGLLVAHRNPSNGYRMYTKDHLIRLQQILIYKEMDFSIIQIKQLLQQDNENLQASLFTQKQHLQTKAAQLNALINKIEVSMKQLNKQTIDATLYEGISEEKAKQWESQSIEKYSQQKIDATYKRLGKLNKEQIEHIKIEGEQIAIDIANSLDLQVDSESVQVIVKRHHCWIENFYDAPFDVYTSLADMYLESEEFTEFYDKHKKGSTEFLNQAIHYFAKENLL